MLGSAKITSKGQITLPVKVRKQLYLNPGDTLVFEIIDGELKIRKARNIENYFNTLPPLNISEEEMERQLVADIWSDK